MFFLPPEAIHSKLLLITYIVIILVGVFQRIGLVKKFRKWFHSRIINGEPSWMLAVKNLASENYENIDEATSGLRNDAGLMVLVDRYNNATSYDLKKEGLHQLFEYIRSKKE